MAFPYRPSVHDDLRDLFGYRRVESTNRRLGSSSITKGEGSLDLWETETGPVVARYGDLPDGSFGVGVAHRGAFVNISNLIGDTEDRLDGHDTTLGQHSATLSSHNTRITAAQSRADGAHTRLNGVDSTLSSHNTRISSAQSRADDAHGDAATAQSRADSAWTRAGTGIADAAAAHSRADVAWTRADAARKRADDAYAIASAAATSNKVAALEAEIDALQTQVGVMDSWLRAHTGYPNGGLNPNP